MSGREADDLYAVLGLDPKADPLSIRRAYQRLARRLHPGFDPGDSEARARFRRVRRAYEVLSDPVRRRRHDAGEPDPGSRRPRRTPNPGDVLVGVTARFEELVGVLVGRDGQAAIPDAPDPDRDIESEVALDFAEALRGTTISISAQREDLCPVCAADSEHRAACDECGGRGLTVSLERLRVRIPAGVTEGGRVRLAGRGNRGSGTIGDLFLIIRVRPHPYFRQSGWNISAGLPLTLAEAALGAEVEVPTVDGPVKVRIPAGTPSGQRFRLPRHGALRPDGSRGDHFYRVEIVVPRNLDESSRRLLRRLEQPDPRTELPSEPL